MATVRDSDPVIRDAVPMRMLLLCTHRMMKLVTVSEMRIVAICVFFFFTFFTFTFSFFLLSPYLLLQE